MSYYDDEPEQENQEPEAHEPAEDFEDFDSFWRKENTKRPPKGLTIFGERVKLPKALPLQFVMEAQRRKRSDSEDDVQQLIAILFNDADLIDRWIDKGMDLQQFQVVLAWSVQYVNGGHATFADVAADLAARDSDSKGSTGEA